MCCQEYHACVVKNIKFHLLMQCVNRNQMIENKTCNMIILLIVACAILDDHKTAE